MTADEYLDNNPWIPSGYTQSIGFYANYNDFGLRTHGRIIGVFINNSMEAKNSFGILQRNSSFSETCNAFESPTSFGGDAFGSYAPWGESLNINKPTDMVDIIKGSLRIRQQKLVMPTTSGDIGQLGWDQYGLICYTSNSWKRAPLLEFTTTVTNPTSDSVALTVDGDARLTATANDLQAAVGYVPQTNQSLVTKGSMENGTISARLPISSADKTVTLSSPEESVFELIAKGGDFNPTFMVQFEGRATEFDPSIAIIKIDSQPRFTVTDNDIQAWAGYVPQTDQSLVTKANILDTDITSPTTPNVTLRYDAPSSKWVDSGAGSVIVGSRPLTGWEAGTVGEALENGLAGATLPISSADETVTLSRPEESVFELSANGGDFNPTYMVQFEGRATDFEPSSATIKIDSQPRFTVTSNDIQAFAGYIPQTDDSLVTKGYVTNAGGGMGTLPISSTDGTVTLASPSGDVFSVTTNNKERIRVDEETTTILPKSGVTSIINDFQLTNALKLYDDAFGNKIGFGITTATLNIAACNDVANIDLYTKSQLSARFNQDGIRMFTSGAERFRIRADGRIGIGDSVAGATWNGIRTSWVPTENNWTNYYAYDTFSDTGVLLAYGTIIAPRVETQNTLQYLTYSAYPPVQVNGGTLKSHVGFMHQNSTICTEGATAFKSMQNSADGEYYAFYAAGTAPSRFNAPIQTNTITTELAATDDAKITLTSSNVLVEAEAYTSFVLNNNRAGNVINFRNENNVNYYVGMSEVLGFQVIDTDASSVLLSSKSGVHTFNKSGYNNGYQLQIQDDRIRTANDYVPSNDYDLVTKKWVEDNASSTVVRGSVAATGTQTDFTVTEGYTPNQLDVYVNGIKMLDTTDYSATNGSTITLVTPAASGDIVQYTAYESVSVAVASIQTGTPSSSSDSGSVGDIKHDDDYVWIKTSAGWKKSPLYTYDQTPSLTIRVTQAEYDGLTPDPAITYVIVG
jgi:hypothetical protein